MVNKCDIFTNLDGFKVVRNPPLAADTAKEKYKIIKQIKLDS